MSIDCHEREGFSESEPLWHVLPNELHSHCKNYIVDYSYHIPE